MKIGSGRDIVTPLDGKRRILIHQVLNEDRRYHSDLYR